MAEIERSRLSDLPLATSLSDSDLMYATEDGVSVKADISLVRNAIIGDRIKDVALNIANEYDAAETYNTGDLCIYNNILYVCLADNVTGAWDLTKWQYTTLSETTFDVPTKLSDLDDDSEHRLVTDEEKAEWDSKSDFSGDYNDLDNKPELAEVATSGSYNDLDDTPNIPEALSDLSDDATHRVVTDAEKETWNGKSDFSGSYNDLTDKPTIPSALADLTDDSTHRVVTDTEKTTWDNKSDFSGSYNDLTDKPTIPEVEANGATIPKAELDTLKVDATTYEIFKQKCYGEIVNADIASFNDGADAPLEKLEISIDAVQDLHGYDKPWPPNATVNKLPNSLSATKELNGIKAVSDGFGGYTITGTATADTIITFDLVTSYVIPNSGTQGGTGVFYVGNDIANNNFGILLYNNNTLIDSWVCNTVNRTTASYGSMAGKTMNKLGFKVISGTSGPIHFNPMFTENGSTSESFIPYSNICPISGWSGAYILNNVGINQWDEEWELGGFVWATGQPSSATDRIRSKNFCTCKPNTRYYIKNPTGGINILWYNSNKDFILRNVANNTTLTSPPNAYFFKICNTNSATYNNNISINYPSTDTEYHAYSGQSVNVSFGQTVYGGSLDVSKGILTVTHTKFIVDNVATQGTSSGNIFFRKGLSVTGINTTASNKDDQISNMLKCNDVYALGAFLITSNGSSLHLCMTDQSIDTVEKMNTWLSSNELYVCYLLATPTTIQLTPTQIRSLLGLNNIYADCGKIKDVKYLRDLNSCINDIIARIEALEG